jgi:aspartate racemase
MEIEKNNFAFQMGKKKIDGGIIGIVGGMGPLAGMDLTMKIFSQTIAEKDQDHLPVILYSTPQLIGDRTEYLTGRIKENPGYVIAQILFNLEAMGCSVAGLSCNTAHATQIFSLIQNELSEKNSSIRLLHIIKEAGNFIKMYFPEVTRVGVLGTNGTYFSNLYGMLSDFDLVTVNVSPEEQENVHSAIYHPDYGIKSSTGEIKEEAGAKLFHAADSLIEKKSELIVLGCTELPLVFKGSNYKGITLVDATMVLARALINDHSPQKLKPWLI